MRKDRFEDLDFIDFNDSRRQEGTVIADMLSAVYRNRKWFILSVAVCVLIGFLYLKSSPKIFLRTATVLVKDEQKGGGGKDAENGESKMRRQKLCNLAAVSFPKFSEFHYILRSGRYESNRHRASCCILKRVNLF